MEKPNYYAVIPANIRYDKDLTANAKLLYGEISALAQKNGVCFATNEYFSKLYNLSERAISRLICSLKDKNYIKVEIDNSESNKKHRQICLGGIDKNDNNTLDKNVQYNNTSSINNTSITKIPIVPLTNYEENLSTQDCISDEHEETQDEKDEYNFNIIWNDYPRREGKTKSYMYYKQWIKGRKINGRMIKLGPEQIDNAVLKYAKEKKYTDLKYIQIGSTFFNTTILDYIDME